MAVYTLDGLTLDVGPVELEGKADIPYQWSGLSWRPTDRAEPCSGPRIVVRLHDAGSRVPADAIELFTADGVSVFERGSDCFVSDGFSVFHLHGDHLEFDAHLAPSFFSKPVPLQCNFWCFGLLKLLRRLGYYSLHTACVVAPGGSGILISGASGSGKSTLAVALVREGWNFLSDDAVLLQRKPGRIIALALRKHFHIDADAAPRYSGLPMSPATADAKGRERYRLHLDHIYPQQETGACLPGVLVFPRIAATDRSSLRPLPASEALKNLLAASGPQLFDRRTMGQHLETLKTLLRQTAVYELDAGRDVYERPGLVADLLVNAQPGGSHGAHCR
jgi:hypothetical protein